MKIIYTLATLALFSVNQAKRNKPERKAKIQQLKSLPESIQKGLNSCQIETCGNYYFSDNVDCLACIESCQELFPVEKLFKQRKCIKHGKCRESCGIDSLKFVERKGFTQCQNRCKQAALTFVDQGEAKVLEALENVEPAGEKQEKKINRIHKKQALVGAYKKVRKERTEKREHRQCIIDQCKPLLSDECNSCKDECHGQLKGKRKCYKQCSSVCFPEEEENDQNDDNEEEEDIDDELNVIDTKTKFQECKATCKGKEGRLAKNSKIEARKQQRANKRACYAEKCWTPEIFSESCATCKKTCLEEFGQGKKMFQCRNQNGCGNKTCFIQDAEKRQIYKNCKKECNVEASDEVENVSFSAVIVN